MKIQDINRKETENFFVGNKGCLLKEQHKKDLEQGYGAVYLWPSLERKYPHIAKEWGWQYMFPAKKLSVDPRSSQIRRHHIMKLLFKKPLKRLSEQLV